MPKKRRKLHEAAITLRVPATMAARLERVAPTEEGRRTAFIRAAIEAALERVERERAGGEAA